MVNAQMDVQMAIMQILIINVSNAQTLIALIAHLNQNAIFVPRQWF
jgi:hypothetical protein